MTNVHYVQNHAPLRAISMYAMQWKRWSISEQNIFNIYYVFSIKWSSFTFSFTASQHSIQWILSCVLVYWKHFHFIKCFTCMLHVLGDFIVFMVCQGAGNDISCGLFFILKLLCSCNSFLTCWVFLLLFLVFFLHYLFLGNGCLWFGGQYM